MNVGRRRNRGGVSHQRFDLFHVKRMFGGQQVPQSIVHGVLTFVSCQLQNLHIHFVRYFLCMTGS